MKMMALFVKRQRHVGFCESGLESKVKVKFVKAKEMSLTTTFLLDLIFYKTAAAVMQQDRWRYCISVVSLGMFPLKVQASQ